MKKVILSLIAIAGAFLLTAGVAKAQYDGEVIEPRYENGAEIFGIKVDKNKQISFFPQGCKSIDKVVLEFSEAVDGEIIVTSKGEESPQGDKEVEKVFEYCNFEWKNINKDHVSKFEIDSKVRKSWLDSQKVSENDIALYSFVDGEWETNTSKRDKDNAIYFYYKSDKVKMSDNFAVGENKGGFTLPFGLSPVTLIICCVLFLLVLLLVSVFYSMSSRNKTKNVNVEAY